MSKASHIQTNFTTGELSPKLFGRVDVTKYENGAETLQNFVPMPFGGAQRVPGTVFVGEVRDSSEAARLIPFQFSTTQAYILEFNNSKIRFYRNNGRIVESSVTVTGLSQAAAAVVTAAGHGYSDGDYVILSTIVGDAGSPSLETFINGKEYLVANKTADTFEIQDRNTGAAIDTSSYPAYVSGGISEKIYEIASPYAAADLSEIQVAQTADVMYIVHEDYAPRKLSRTGHTAWTLTQVTFTGGPFMPVNTTAITMDPNVQALDATGVMVASAAYFTEDMVGTYFYMHEGYVEVTAFNSTTNVDIIVRDEMTGHAATATWQEGSWSDERGYPRAVSFYEQRLAFAGSTEEPQTVWLSVTESYEDMEAGEDVDDALIYTIATEQVNAIQWLSAAKVLALGTSGGVFSLSSGTNEDALTPTNVIVKRESTFGAAPIIPKKIGAFTYYIQRDTLTLRELFYSFEIDAYRAVNITILSDHITAGGIVEIDYQQAPYNILWCVRGDGKLCTLTRELDQEVAAWAEHTAGGTGSFENVAVIQASTVTDGDEVWFIVNRTIDGSTVRCVEYLAKFDWGSDDEDAILVQSSLEYDGASTTTLTGLDHLEGEEVYVYGNGENLGAYTVSGGAITGSTAVTKAHVGLLVNATIKTLRIEAGARLGTAQGQFKRINNVIVRVYKTRQLKIGDADNQYDQDLTEMTTGDEEAHLDQAWDLYGQVVVLCDQPVPCTILAIIKQLTTEER